MTVFTWLWIAWFAAFAGVEGVALVVKDRPADAKGGLKLRTLTANVRWLITGAGPWHHVARAALAVLLAWLPFHFGLPFTDWPSVWPNVVASVIWSVPAVLGFIAHHRKVKAHVTAQHERLFDRLRADLIHDARVRTGASTVNEYRAAIGEPPLDPTGEVTP